MIVLNVRGKKPFPEIKLVKDNQVEEELIEWRKDEILQQEKYFRTKMINSLAGVRQVTLIGTRSKNGQENLAIFNSIIHLGANPALFGFISRPDSVERDTLGNIKETESYTVNLIGKNWMKEAHQTSARYKSNISEFNEVGLTPEYIGNIEAPFVKEACIKIEMKLQDILEIKLNGTIMVIGSIESLQIPKNRLKDDGLVDPTGLLLSGGLDAYYESNFLEQLPYAKP